MTKNQKERLYASIQDNGIVGFRHDIDGEIWTTEKYGTNMSDNDQSLHYHWVRVSNQKGDKMLIKTPTGYTDGFTTVKL